MRIVDCLWMNFWMLWANWNIEEHRGFFVWIASLKIQFESAGKQKFSTNEFLSLSGVEFFFLEFRRYFDPRRNFFNERGKKNIEILFKTRDVYQFAACSSDSWEQHCIEIENIPLRAGSFYRSAETNFNLTLLLTQIIDIEPHWKVLEA